MAEILESTGCPKGNQDGPHQPGTHRQDARSAAYRALPFVAHELENGFRDRAHQAAIRITGEERAMDGPRCDGRKDSIAFTSASMKPRSSERGMPAHPQPPAAAVPVASMKPRSSERGMVRAGLRALQAPVVLQ